MDTAACTARAFTLASHRHAESHWLRDRAAGRALTLLRWMKRVDVIEHGTDYFRAYVASRLPTRGEREREQAARSC